MLAHGTIRHAVFDRIAVIQALNEVNREFMDQIEALFVDINSQMAVMRRPLLRVIDIRKWGLGPPEVLDRAVEMNRAAVEAGFLYTVEISRKDHFVTDIYHRNVTSVDPSRRFFTTSPEEAWETIRELGFDPPAIPDFLLHPPS